MNKSLRDYFIPHAGNDYIPHALQRTAMLMMLGLILLTFTTANLQSLLWFSSDWLVSTILPSVIVDLTNDERGDLTLSPLKRNLILDEAARLKAEHMAQNSYFAHYSPDGTSPWYWFTQAGYPYVHAGENLAIHFSDSVEVVDAWMESPSHRANIANVDYREIGVGTARGTYQGFDTVYVVQLFGAPAASAVPTANTVVVESVTESPEPSSVLASEVAIEMVPTPAETVVNNIVEEVVVVPEPAPEPTEPPVELLHLAQVTPEPDPTPVETQVEDIEVSDDMVSLYSGTIATTAKNAVPASTDTVDGSGAERQSTVFGEIATSPSVLLQVMYALIGMFVVTLLLISILIEVRQQRPLQIAYSLCLLVVMSGLFYVHSVVTSGAVIA